MTSSTVEGQKTPSLSAMWKYDVHLSYNGEEIQDKFVGHFNNALRVKKINTTFDGSELPRGEEISKTEIKAIEESRIFVPVISPRYAFSTRCLDELVKSFDLKLEKGQVVLPIFYEIDPSEVRNLRGNCREAMAQHREKFKNEEIKVLRWENALQDVADLAGRAFKTGSELDFIQRLVEDIGTCLDCQVGQLSCQTELQMPPDPRSLYVLMVRKNEYRQTGSHEKESEFQKREEVPKASLNGGCVDSALLSTTLVANHSAIEVQPLTSIACTSNERGKHLGPKTSVVQLNGLSNVLHTEQIRKRNEAEFSAAAAHSKQTQAEKGQRFESRVNQSSVSGGVEHNLVSIEQNRSDFHLTWNNTNIGALSTSLGTETTSLSVVQETKNAMHILQILFSKRFSEIILFSSELKVMEDIIDNLFKICEDDKISMRMSSIVRQLSSCFTQWSQAYKDANVKRNSTTAELSKVSELEASLATIDKESLIAVSSVKEMCIQLACLEKKKAELEEQLKVVTAKITDLSSYNHMTAERKKLLLDKGSKLVAERNDLMIRVPGLKASQAAARLTQERIEAEWLKLGEQFNRIFTLEFGCS